MSYGHKARVTRDTDSPDGLALFRATISLVLLVIGQDAGTIVLRPRSNQATAGVVFEGLVDEFRLYKTALTQDSIKGLLWFLKGSNSLVIPRGVFYGSKMYKQLSDTATNFSNANSPLMDAKVYGNSNTLASNLNSRVIQMVITKNLTLAQAWGILDLARTNKSGNVTAFAFFATDEFYTLGFGDEVNSLVANTSIVNGGNTSVAPPPTSWQLFWNTIAGWAERAWNALLAVGAFFTNLGKWLVQAFIAYVKGLTTGNWTDFQNQVIEPLAEAVRAVVRWALDLIAAVFSAAMSAIYLLVEKAAGRIAAVLDIGVQAALKSLSGGGKIAEEGLRQIEIALFHSGGSSLYELLIAAFGLVQVLIFAASLVLMSTGVEWVVDVGVVGLLISAVLGSIAVGVLLGEGIAIVLRGETGLSAPGIDRFLEDVLGGVVASLFFGGVNLMIESYMLKQMLAAKAEPFGILMESVAFSFALIGFILAVYYSVHPPSDKEEDKRTAAVFGVMSVIGALLSGFAILKMRKLPGFAFLKVLPVISLALAGIGVAVAVAKGY